MPTVKWNAATWNGGYDWSSAGEEWSQVWGGSESQWYGSILSRVGSYFPIRTILEIAPGYGRWTRFLLRRCVRLIGIDLSEECVQLCQERFAGYPRAKFYVNDGKSLKAVADGSVDFVFSFDSLVHAEDDILESYVAQIADKFTPNGIGLIHHSNLGACAPGTANSHQRAASMTADKFLAFCSSAGLACISQEIVNWGQPELVDCLSLFTTAGSTWDRPLCRLENPRFMLEAEMLKTISSLYHAAPLSNSR
jgi:SAM-dependent methyltransferase